MYHLIAQLVKAIKDRRNLLSFLALFCTSLYVFYEYAWKRSDLHIIEEIVKQRNLLLASDDLVSEVLWYPALVRLKGTRSTLMLIDVMDERSRLVALASLLGSPRNNEAFTNRIAAIIKAKKSSTDRFESATLIFQFAKDVPEKLKKDLCELWIGSEVSPRVAYSWGQFCGTKSAAIRMDKFDIEEFAYLGATYVMFDIKSQLDDWMRNFESLPSFLQVLVLLSSPLEESQMEELASKIDCDSVVTNAILSSKFAKCSAPSSAELENALAESSEHDIEKYIAECSALSEVEGAHAPVLRTIQKSIESNNTHPKFAAVLAQHQHFFRAKELIDATQLTVNQKVEVYGIILANSRKPN